MTIAQQSDHRIAELVRNIDSVITLPEVAARIIQTINDPNSTAGDLQKIITHDPALVSLILQRVNSSFYGGPTKIDSVERAVVLMGFGAVNALAVSATLGRVFKPIKICDDFTARIYGRTASPSPPPGEIAKRVNRQIADEAFLAGLLHDIGLLVELQVCPDELCKVCEIAKSGSTTFNDAELAMIGCNHADLGAAFAKKWNFPESCCAAITFHHNPELAEAEHRQLVAIIYVADTLCCEHSIGFNLTALGQTADLVATPGLIPLGVIEHIQQGLPKLISDAMAILAS